MRTLADNPRFEAFFRDMDHMDIKHITADVSLRQFIGGMLYFNPWWLAMLYRLREILVKLLGLVEHDRPERLPVPDPDTISFRPGGQVLFFTVRMAEENQFWIAETPPDNHLVAYFGVVAQHLSSGMTRFSVFTTVRYLHWTGPVYFNSIKPFHHLVVNRMMRAGTAAPKRGTTTQKTNDSDKGLIDHFSLKERLLSRIGWYGFMVVGAIGIVMQSPIWGAVYLAYSFASFGLVIFPGLCAHCPYPSRYSTCLFLPPGFIKRLYPYKGPQMHPLGKILVFVTMAGVVMMPQFWLIASPPMFLIFWFIALPILITFPRHYCRHCRHLHCPMNRAST